ncbi:unnamed protein product, partial [Vitis vinifera]
MVHLPLCVGISNKRDRREESIPIRGLRKTSRPTKSGGSRSKIRRRVKIGRGHKGSGTGLMSTTSFIHKARFEPFHNCWGFRKTRQKRYRCRWQLNMRWKEILIFKENHISGNSYTTSMGI